jgi:uncharacterized protein (DUF2141 family)
MLHSLQIIPKLKALQPRPLGPLVLLLSLFSSACQLHPVQENKQSSQTIRNRQAADQENKQTSQTLKKRQAPVIKLQIEMATKGKKQLGVLVFKGEKGFPENNELACQKFWVKIDDAETTQTTVTIDHLTTGMYAITVFSDLNLNQQLDKGFMGIPLEPVGCSNVTDGLLVMPSFAKAGFALNNEIKTIKITLKKYVLGKIDKQKTRPLGSDDGRATSWFR